ncbi:uncharacterized glutathione S-transferase-like protein [alpha proteobacterium U9-1i]|nr:uncharacterized glutathione S-transferase-like protein [alpha proteobacterium U9-1i]
MDLGDPNSATELNEAWPVGKIPVLKDGARIVPETSVQIEYLDRKRGGAAMIPADPEAALEARLWDRFFDNYVMTPMSKIVTDRIRPDGKGDAHGVEEARALLRMAYGVADKHLATRQWVAGGAFGLADCAAEPALFYAECVEPFSGGYPNLARYFDRLFARPSVQRVTEEARPFFKFFPYREAMPARLLG